MSPNEHQIRTYLALLRPHPTIESGSFCLLCLEPYEPFSEIRDTDYPASPYLRRPGSQCHHVFGRICIERHIRSGQWYSSRCPVCREQWIVWQAGVDDHFELDDDPLSRVIARHVHERLGSDDDADSDGDATSWTSMETLVSGLSTLPVRARSLEDSPGFSVTGRVNRSIGLLERMQTIYRLQHVDADELVGVIEVESAVERLWQRLDERNQFD